jgi:hypothetical protein
MGSRRHCGHAPPSEELIAGESRVSVTTATDQNEQALMKSDRSDEHLLHHAQTTPTAERHLPAQASRAANTQETVGARSRPGGDGKSLVDDPPGRRAHAW